MIIFTWILIAFSVLSIVGKIALIGHERGPYTQLEAIINTIVQLLLIAALIYFYLL